LLRRDIEQADVTAIMASLIGIPWPINSVGVLPDVDPTRPGYLNPKEGEAMKATAALVNAKVGSNRGDRLHQYIDEVV
jgi:phosphatidylinositol glycan class N